MDVRYSPDPVRFTGMKTEEVRSSFLVEGLFVPGMSEFVYSDIDRSITGSAVPHDSPLELTSSKELAADHFLANREMGVFNTGGAGIVTVDGTSYGLAHKDCLYISRGSREVAFASADVKSPAMFYLVSYPAHASFPTTLVKREDAKTMSLGDSEHANVRNIYKYICPENLESCQLVMGITELESGSVWNTMPSHTHERRSEIYMYCDFPESDLVLHLMGKPDETRHIMVRTGQAVLSPSWSIHSGCGTQAYSFVWSMGGENQEFSDMDALGMDDLK